MIPSEEKIVFENPYRLHSTMTRIAELSPSETEQAIFFPNPYSSWFERTVLKREIRSQDLELGSLLLPESANKSILLTWNSDPAMEKHIRDAGYTVYESQEGMILTERTILPESKWKGDPSIVVSRIEDEEEIPVWLGIVNDAFGSFDESDLYKRAFRQEVLEFYAVYSKKIMVSTALIFADSDSIGLYSVTTSPEYKNRGFASFLVSEILREYRAEIPVTLQATRAGKSIYERLGFRSLGKFLHWSKLPS
ncbi:GNAT family N-acetyltransferase [Leptospira fletcheri]|nr:GNAT family N-acetyltransferase [Leptospira fletcheri]